MPTAAEKEAIKKARQQAAVEREERAREREAAAIRVQCHARRYMATTRVQQRREHLKASGEMARVILSQVCVALLARSRFTCQTPCGPIHPTHTCTCIHPLHLLLHARCVMCIHAALYDLARGPTRGANCRLPGLVLASSRSRARAPEVERVEESVPAERAAGERAGLPRLLPLILSRTPSRRRLSRSAASAYVS